ncbi:hypothetical protein SUGI_0192120 [Cryptomeria japonica]|nr:hypothetical protein SUGI_0192120 [Cryptomeria japonica]
MISIISHGDNNCLNYNDNYSEIGFSKVDEQRHAHWFLISGVFAYAEVAREIPVDSEVATRVDVRGQSCH